MKLTNTYLTLGEHFYQEIEPTPVTSPDLFLWNEALASELSVSEQIKNRASHYFSGNERLEGSQPIAQAYAGHQFGSYNPQLGDGRAHLLGDTKNLSGKIQEIQLKGSGPTRYSRRGDGRCALGPAVREFIMSQAMHSLGVPTTKALAVVTTGEKVWRQSSENGAVVTRVASSHLRVGTFQYIAALDDKHKLEQLLEFAIERHYPQLSQHEQKALAFLDCVIKAQIKTVVEWMRVGFIHGVMNTDNTTISGETIDYGPCAMMGKYHPLTVFSSIDRDGRYSFGNQPWIMQWNMARLAESLITLVDDDADKAVSMLEPYINGFAEQLKVAYYQMMYDKLGLIAQPKREFVDKLLTRMQELELDYTQTFAELTQSLAPVPMEALNTENIKALGDVYDEWLSLVTTQPQADTREIMRKSNPLVIPRNHHIESVISQCELTGKPESAIAILKVLTSPYHENSETKHYQDAGDDNDKYYQTFCGT
ncbi:protein adenylyltransferase SelO [Vibrio tapetis]|uniref:Protein nucleotidyltransferase YdiU n=1 Tax=Vibrio tapetis subsp. tapetis TaxID=1671868 RepID=A0A2N8Z9W7_9VIBR|nr:YdiU family protein [Vibrio tapetis]SON48701.1 conserved protein of unknown function [Vibrio tapetis subsp. tapetis]